MTDKPKRSRREIWAEMGVHDGYDGKFRPPKFGNADCLAVYLDAWAGGTTAAIKDSIQKTENPK